MNNFDEALILKIFAIIFAIWFVRKAWQIIAGKDGMQASEFYQLVGLFLFMALFTYMIYKEGNRTDCNSHVYNEWYVAIVSGSLLTVLHLDSALTNIIKIIDALAKMRAGKTDTP